MIEPLRVSVDVACSVEHAFAVWTTRIAAWWPGEHKGTSDPSTDVLLEPRIGGRLYERTAAGVEHEWGEITAWEPPTRLGYLWHIRRDRADATDVDIRFVRVAPDRTRVDVVHSGWERLGTGGQDWRDRNHAGWDGVLPFFVAAAEAADDTHDADADHPGRSR